jgi:hypothetical protein
VERETRLELATLALARRCSTTELLPLRARSILAIRFGLSSEPPEAASQPPDAASLPPGPVGGLNLRFKISCNFAQSLLDRRFQKDERSLTLKVDAFEVGLCRHHARTAG